MLLYPLTLLFCLIGVYSINNNMVEIFIMVSAGVAGLVLRRLGFDGAPFLLALVLGPMMESSLRQALLISRGQLRDLLHTPGCWRLDDPRRSIFADCAGSHLEVETGETGGGKGE